MQSSSRRLDIKSRENYEYYPYKSIKKSPGREEKNVQNIICNSSHLSPTESNILSKGSAPQQGVTCRSLVEGCGSMEKTVLIEANGQSKAAFAARKGVTR